MEQFVADGLVPVDAPLALDFRDRVAEQVGPDGGDVSELRRRVGWQQASCADDGVRGELAEHAAQRRGIRERRVRHQPDLDAGHRGFRDDPGGAFGVAPLRAQGEDGEFMPVRCQRVRKLPRAERRPRHGVGLEGQRRGSEEGDAAHGFRVRGSMSGDETAGGSAPQARTDGGPAPSGTAASLLRPRAFVLLLVLVAGVMRLHGLGDKSLWVDELYALDQAKILTEIADVCAAGNTPPGRHYMIHFLMGPSQTEARVRLPSALFGIASIPMMFLLVRRIGGDAAGLVAATLLAFSPWHLMHSQDGRMYTVFLFFVLLTLWAYWNAADTGRRFWWAMCGFAMALGAWISYFALWTSFIVVLFAGLRIAVVAAGDRARARSHVLAGATGLAITLGSAAIGYSPWVPVIARLVFKYHPQEAAPPPPAPEFDGAPINPFLTRWDASYFTDFLRKLGVFSTEWSLLFFGLFLAGLCLAAARHRRFFFLTLLWFLVPLAILAKSASVRHFFPPRYLYFFIIPYMALIGVAVAAIGEWIAGRLGAGRVDGTAVRTRIAAVAFLAAPLVLLQLRDDVAYYRVEKQPWREATAFLAANTRPGDIVLTGQGWSELAVIFYGGDWLRMIELRPKVYQLDKFESALRSRRGAWLINWGPLIPVVQDIVDRNTRPVRVFPGINGDVHIYRNEWTRDPGPQPAPPPPARVVGG